MSKVIKVMVGVMVVLPALYIGSCSVISKVHDRDFDRVKERDGKAQVVATMGEPSDTEIAGRRSVPQYGASKCKSPCAERLWYLNRLSLIGEAWVVELGGNWQVIRTVFIESP